MESILFERIGEHIAKLSLNRPEVYNSFNRNMALSLQQQLDVCAADETIRVILLTGNGKAFCAGQDLQEIVAEDGPSMFTILSEHYNPIIERIRGIEKPVVCAVNGVAAGAGANLALACDITVAAESASFIQAFSKIGLIPDSGGTFNLPRLIGMQRAAAFMMLGERVSAIAAETMGMIYKTCPDDQLDATATGIATQLAQLPPIGLGLTKRALNRSLTNDLTAQLALEEALQVEAGMTEDFQEGVAAFLEKRKAVFRGR